MAPLDLFNDGSKFHEIETSRGNIMISSDLLIAPRTWLDGNTDLCSSQSEELDNKVPPKLYPSSALSGLDIPGENAALSGGEHLPSPEAYSTTLGSTSPIKDAELCPIDPEPCLPNSLNCGQTQDELPVAVSQSINSYDKTESAPLHVAKLDSRVRMSSTLEQPITTTNPGYSNLSCEGYVLNENNQLIPSYMSPEAIRARNVILTCDPPPKQTNIESLHPGRAQPVSFCEDG